MLMGSPKHSAACESSLALDAEARPALRDRHQFDDIDVEVGWQSRQPPEEVGKVVRGHRVHARIELFGRLPVTAGPNDGELGLGHARLDRGYAHASAGKVATKIEGELTDEGLGAGVNSAALVGIGGGDRGQVD